MARGSASVFFRIPDTAEGIQTANLNHSSHSDPVMFSLE
jgi:hypothetical protein